MAEAVTPTSPTMSSEYTEDQHHSSTPATSDDDDDDSEVGHGYPRMRTAFRVMAVSFICAVIGILFILVPFVLTPNPMANMKRYIATGIFFIAAAVLVFVLNILWCKYSEYKFNKTYNATHEGNNLKDRKTIFTVSDREDLLNITRLKAEDEDVCKLYQVPLPNGNATAATNGYLTNHTTMNGSVPKSHQFTKYYSQSFDEDDDGGFKDYVPHRRKLLPYTHSYSPHSSTAAEACSHWLSLSNFGHHPYRDRGPNIYTNITSPFGEQSQCFCIECRPDLYHELYTSPRYADSYQDYFNTSFRKWDDERPLQPSYRLPSLFGQTNRCFYI